MTPREHRHDTDARNRSRCSQTFLLLAILISASCVCHAQRDRYAGVRAVMVKEVLEAEGITNENVLKAMGRVPRHEFVPGNLRARAYDDTALAIGSRQTISPPFIVAYMTETIDPQPTDRVLEIGTGSGYQAAVLGEIVQDVYSIEIVSNLSKSASKRLESLKYNNVHCLHGDGYKGWPEHAPFDKVIVTCSPENVPQPLVDQLKEGGLMIIPLGERYQQSFYLMQKKDGKLEQKRLVSTLFVPMTGESEDQRRILPDGKKPQVVNGDFEFDENEDGRVDGWHYQRQTELSTEQPMSGTLCLRFKNLERGELSQALQGCAVDGRAIGALDIAVWARVDSVVPGPAKDQFAGMVIHFYDAVRRELGYQVVKQWRGSGNWQETRRRIPVAPNVREIIVRIGLNGSTGTLDLDNLRLRGVLR